jgi:hypothetical protein
MASPFSLRLDDKTRRKLSRMARRGNLSASDVVRNAIESLADREESPAQPYKLIADLIGAVRGGNPRRSEQTGRQFEALLKRARRRKKK